MSRIDLDLETLSLGTAAGLKAFVEGVVQRVLDLAAISSNDPAKLRAGPGPLPQGR